MSLLGIEPRFLACQTDWNWQNCMAVCSYAVPYPVLGFNSSWVSFHNNVFFSIPSFQPRSATTIFLCVPYRASYFGHLSCRHLLEKIYNMVKRTSCSLKKGALRSLEKTEATPPHLQAERNSHPFRCEKLKISIDKEYLWNSFMKKMCDLTETNRNVLVGCLMKFVQATGGQFGVRFRARARDFPVL